MEIVIGRTVDTSVLFTSEADTIGVDVQASAEKFDDMLVARVQSAFPGSMVTLGDGYRVYDDAVEGDANPFDSMSVSDVNNTVSHIVDAITEDGSWIVEAQ